MKINYKRTTYILAAVLALSLLFTLSVLAGNINSSATPDATNSYTLADIYNRLNAGTDGTQSTFTEPAAGPGSTMNDLNTIMSIAPAIDNTNGAVAADVAAGKTFWDLTSGEWGEQTGTAFGAPVPKTGQTTGYYAGDDGDLERGVSWPNPRFTDNSDGTVTDNLTGLIWLKNANCYGTRSWTSALSVATSLANGQCALTDGSSAGDWRLPNRNEMESLVHNGFVGPAVPNTLGTGRWSNGNPFFNVSTSYYYWSSTSYAGSSSYAWAVWLNIGRVYELSKNSNYYVWPVRAGQ